MLDEGFWAEIKAGGEHLRTPNFLQLPSIFVCLQKLGASAFGESAFCSKANPNSMNTPDFGTLLHSLPDFTLGTSKAIATAVWERISRLRVLSSATFRLRALLDVLSRHRHEESRSRLGFFENSPGEANTYPIEGKTSLDPVS